VRAFTIAVVGRSEARARARRRSGDTSRDDRRESLEAPICSLARCEPTRLERPDTRRAPLLRAGGDRQSGWPTIVLV
jgi:hypothetical protein